MKFVADLHVHSRFSRATARNLDLEHLYISAQRKGISVVGTGDFTHPGWFEELSEKLEPAEPGLFRLSDELTRSCDEQVPEACRRAVRFLLSTEISNIYKKEERTRKNHNLVFLPDLKSVQRFNAALDSIGNLHSDGRPILGLDARDLLEIVLETTEQGFLVPAHIWTPWFSALGSKSGFDSIEQCFADLSEHIFAVETGLSSDPPMNWRISTLDGRTLISNSDAHSPQKLGREANLFDSDLSYHGIQSALKTGDPKRFLGTIEFYPEEGKYHLDGHRKCGLRIHPRETKKHSGTCPVCGRQLTLGVLHRVEQLADRAEGHRPPKAHPYVHLIPLVEVLSDLFRVGPGTKKVVTAYNQLLEKFGSEDFILRGIESELLDKYDGVPLLGEAVRRVREKRITILPGYDGEFGRVCIFEPQERKKLLGQQALFSCVPAASQQITDSDATRQKNTKKQQTVDLAGTTGPQSQLSEFTAKTFNGSLLESLNAEQRRAVTHTRGPLIIIAGPGTGKTRTLTHRIAYLIAHRDIEPSRILAVTFTQKAALEMRERLHALLDDSQPLPVVATFHSYCMQMLKARGGDPVFRVIDDKERMEWIRRVMDQNDSIKGNFSAAQIADHIATAKQHLQTDDELPVDGRPAVAGVAAVYRRYQQLLSIQHLLDYEDLIIKGVRLLESGNQGDRKPPAFFDHVLVDEYQDLNFGQYRLVKALAADGAELFVIGDPDQAIYGFRGADIRFFNSFLQDYPEATEIRFDTNYRSCQAILDASRQMMTARCATRDSHRIYSGIMGVPTIGIIESSTEKAEAVAVGKSIEQLLGGFGFVSMDFGQVDERSDIKALGFADVAVLFRTARQGEKLAETLAAAGIPCQLTTAGKSGRDSGVQTILSVFRLLEGVGSYLDFEVAATCLPGDLQSREIKQLTRWGIDHDYSIHQVLEFARRLPLPGLGKNSQRKLFEMIRGLEALRNEFAKSSLHDKLESLVRKLRLPEFDDVATAIGDLVADLQSADGSKPDPVDMISRVSLQIDTDRYNSRVEKVTLLTMHAAKGLEFPVVFVTGCEDDLIPLRLPQKEENNVDEERRLFYVAMTRAKELLFLTYCRKRIIFGHAEARRPSPFLVDIESRLKSFDKSSSRRYQKKRPEQLRLF
ncbi:MAG: hypothetical protein AMJ54_07210 [Deltaproteobacteria bacterium SG8_13]|nr:MAG: hypothetical protein AMJ54_07210 [Deltaproteobacteria bacterium SG8_13]